MQKYLDSVLRSDGRPAAGASVTVTTLDGAVATLYAANGSSPYGSNVLTADASGEYSFYAPNGRYNLAFSYPGFSVESKTDVLLFDAVDAGTPTSSFTASGTGAVPISLQDKLRQIVCVKDFGAVGDGVANDTAAFANAIASIPSGGGSVYVPKGTYMVDSGSIVFGLRPIRLYGDGTGSVIKKRTSGVLIDISGTGTNTRNNGSVLHDLYLHGNDLTGSMVRAWHSGILAIRDTYFWGNLDVGLDLVNVYDSRFTNVGMDFCAGTDGTKPSVLIRNSANVALGAFGYSDDNCNQLVFSNCRFESFKDGGLWIQQGRAANTYPPSGIVLDNCKFESVFIRGPFISLSSYVTHFHMKKCFMYAGGKDTGIATNSITNMIEWTGSGNCTMDDTLVICNADPFWRIMSFWTVRSSRVNFQCEVNVAPGSGYIVSLDGDDNDVAENVAVYYYGSAAGAVSPTTARASVVTLTDADATLYGRTFAKTYRMAPTVARTLTLSGSSNSRGTLVKMIGGDRKRIMNNTGSAGSLVIKNLTSGGTTLKTVTAGNWSDFEFDGTDWQLIGSGAI